MILSEIGNPIEFEFKKILHESQMMKSYSYPNSIFFFNKCFTGECNCRIDIINKNFFISVLFLNYLHSKFKLSEKKVLESLQEIIQQDYKNFEIIPMFDFEIDLYDINFKNNRFFNL